MRLFPVSPRRAWALPIIGSLMLAAWLISWTGLASSGPPSTKPDPAELKKLLADFQQYAEEARQAWQVPGMAIAIVQDDRIIFAKGFGVKKVGATAKVDEHTIFQIGSTSKAFTAALTAMLVDEKKVGWQDRVVDHLPEFALDDPWVTREFRVEDLMAQHSGLPPYAGDGQALLGFDRAHMIRSLRHFQPVTSFRSRYAYQNGLFLVAAALVEKYTGQTWEENVRERIFTPLGMTASSANLQGFRQARNVSVLHRKEEGKVTVFPGEWPYHHWVYTYGPAGGINANVLDMSRWLRLHLGKGTFNGKQLISEANLEFLHTPKTIIGSLMGEMAYYGQGWLYQSRRPLPLIWHNGGTSGHKTMVALVPEANLGIVVLSNLFTELPEALAFRFYDLYFHNPPRDWSKEMMVKEEQARAARKLPPRPASPVPPLPLERYAGTYAHPVYGQIRVAPHSDSLTAVMGPHKNVQLSLQPWDRDTFCFSWPVDMDWTVFVIGPYGRAISMLMDWDGGTEFKRVPEQAP